MNEFQKTYRIESIIHILPTLPNRDYLNYTFIKGLPESRNEYQQTYSTWTKRGFQRKKTDQLSNREDFYKSLEKKQGSPVSFEAHTSRRSLRSIINQTKVYKTKKHFQTERSKSPRKE